MNTIKFHDKKLAYSIEGEGPAVVFLHGFPMDSRVWEGFKNAFTKTFTAITIDLPGFGLSEMIHSQHDMTLMAQAVEAVLVYENIKKATLVGHSMGGYVSVAFAHAYPEKLNGLVLFHSQASADDEAAKQNRNQTITKVEDDAEKFVGSFIASLFDDSFAETQPHQVERFQTMALSQHQQAVIAALAGMRDRESHLQTLSELKIPVLFILGKNDSRVPFARVMAQLALPQQAELLLLSNVAHMGFVEAQEKTSKAILHFALRCN